jgi:MYXO-CTERM domain-containing protein
MLNRPLVRATALATLTLLAGTAQATNLLQNGSFDDQVVTGPYAHKANGTLTGWNSTNSGGGAVLFNVGYKPVSDGINAVQLEWPNDTLFQSFSTTAGQTYVVKFDLSAYDGTAAPLKVEAGSTSQNFTGSNAGYSTYTFQFVAGAGATSTLTFTNTFVVPPAYGGYPHIDKVSVTAVPEAEGYAMALIALGGLALMARRGKSA